jgi:hypothetical protein
MAFLMTFLMRQFWGVVHAVSVASPLVRAVVCAVVRNVPVVQYGAKCPYDLWGMCAALVPAPCKQVGTNSLVKPGPAATIGKRGMAWIR